MIDQMYRLGWSSMVGNLGQVQKENIARLISDLLLLFLLGGLATLFFGAMNDWAGEETAMSTSLERSFGNAWKELWFFGTAFGEHGMTENMFPPIAIFKSLFTKGFGIIATMMHAPEEAAEQFDRVNIPIGVLNNWKMVTSVIPS